MMTIKEFEAATGLKRSAVRFYEEQGLLAPDVRPNGYRSYGAPQLEAVRAIQLGQALGFSIREIKGLMKTWSQGSLSAADRREAVAAKLRDCLEKRSALDLLVAYLEDTLAWMDGGEVGPKPSFDRPSGPKP